MILPKKLLADAEQSLLEFWSPKKTRNLLRQARSQINPPYVSVVKEQPNNKSGDCRYDRCIRPKKKIKLAC